MTGSLIHQAFDPMPYVLLSMASLATGVLLELRTAAAAQKQIDARALPCGQAQQ
jgi:hypothetical protein